MSNFSRHWEFVKEISASLKEQSKVTPSPKKNIFKNDTSDDLLDIQSELEAKFDELFGDIEEEFADRDDDEYYEDEFEYGEDDDEDWEDFWDEDDDE